MTNNFLKQHSRFIFTTIILTIFNGFITLLVPLLLKNIYAENYNLNKKTLALVIFCLVFSFTLQLALLHIRENFAKKFNVSNSHAFLEDIFNMSYDYLIKLEPTYLVNRAIDSVVSLYLFFSGSLVSALGNGLVIVVSLIIFWLIQPSLALFIALVFPLNFFGYRLINRKLQEKSKIMAEKNAKSLQEVVNLFQNVDYLKQEPDFSRIEKLITPPLTSLYEQMADTNKYARSTSLSIELVNNFMQNMMFLWLALAANSNINNLPNLVIASVLFPIYFASIKSFNQINIDAKQLKVATNFRKDELQAHRETDGTEVLNEIQQIDLKHVSVDFLTGTKDYPFETVCQRGDLIYLSGDSGSGKSTLVKALLKFRPSTGISLNKIELARITNQSLRQKIGYLGQDPVIISGTLKDNLLFGRSLDGIQWESLAQSPLLAPIFKEKDWDSIIYEGGTNLSGGEKQRLSIARFLIEDYDCLILDEVTSNLDETAANDILTTLLGQKDKIIFYISHNSLHGKYSTKQIML